MWLCFVLWREFGCRDGRYNLGYHCTIRVTIWWFKCLSFDSTYKDRWMRRACYHQLFSCLSSLSASFVISINHEIWRAQFLATTNYFLASEYQAPYIVYKLLYHQQSWDLKGPVSFSQFLLVFITIGRREEDLELGLGTNKLISYLQDWGTKFVTREETFFFVTFQVHLFQHWDLFAFGKLRKLPFSWPAPTMAIFLCLRNASHLSLSSL